MLHHAAMSEICTDLRFEQPLKASFPTYVKLAGMATEFRFEQSLKAPSSIVVTPLGMSRVVKPVQLQKANGPMDVTLLGMLTEGRLVQPLKAEAPMDVTLLGMVTEVIPVHHIKAAEPMDVTVDGITKFFTSLPFKNIRWATYSGFESPETKVMPHHAAMSEIYTAAMFGHQPKADFPMYVTLLGMVTEVMLLQL